MKDRDLQDEIIRYLTEPAARARPSQALHFAPKEALRAAHFARFLARRYYRDRLARSFRYSAMDAAAKARRATDVVNAAEFTAIVNAQPMASLAAAQCVGRLAVEHLSGVKSEIWWQDLLAYEYAHFLQTATAESSEANTHLQRGPSALCRQFDWDMPALLRRIKAREPIGDDALLRHPVTLIFSRTHAGRIFVMEVNAATAAVFHAVDGNRGAAEIAATAHQLAEAVLPILQSLREVGAVH